MDQRDEHCGRLEEIYEQLHSAYCQFTSSGQSECSSHQSREHIQTPEEDSKTGLLLSNGGGNFTFLSKIKNIIACLCLVFIFQAWKSSNKIYHGHLIVFELLECNRVFRLVHVNDEDNPYCVYLRRK